jgi:small subunit ribosomal protein S5
MENQNPQNNTQADQAQSTAPVATAPKAPTTGAPRTDSRPPRTGGRDFKKNTKRSSRPEKVRSEFDQRILNIRRVTRVVAGGRRFSFSVAIVIGNHKGTVGVGTGKGGDTALAIDKAIKSAKKQLLKIPVTKGMSIAHEVDTKFSSARIIIRPAPGRGLIAGSATRDILELAGVTDVSTKIVSPSKNKLNIARGTIKALSQLRTVAAAPAK